ncbi:MAG: spermidine/putrescine ABC transporter substrate-binding protein [Clostridiales bacterium]|nr:spermidine/putrescine ABC transporter substrate-binding protein [Clostridia bacterium]MCR4884882.1 spermidine/putrescine ABC transporter substrate-binding protein [Clostridiales bacterium]
MKQTVCLFLSLVLLLSAIALPAFADEVVNVFNWEDYIDESVLEDFEAETGIRVNYMRFTTNEDMMVQVEANPGAFDVVFPSDYMVERMLNKGLLEEINYDHIPNSKYILESLTNPDYDPNGAHSIPYMWGTVGILYNTEKVTDPVESWGILWDEKYAGNVFMLDSIRDSMGITLKYLGYPINTREYVQLREATDLLISQKTSGVVKAYQVDETKDKMVAGEAALAVVWSGDAQYAIDLNPALAYAVPKEGSNIWIDPMVIIKNARNLENAEKFVDFLCRPDIAQRNCEEIRYSSPNAAAIELMGEEYTSNTVMNPDEVTVASCEFFTDIPENYLPVYTTLWNEVKNAK